MRLNDLQAELLGKLAENWNNSATAPAAVKNFRPEALDAQTSHPLFPELENLSAGEPTSLPFFVAKGVHWVLLATEQRRLLEGISRLRSWIIPSFGWEDERPFVGPSDSPPGLGSLLLKVSPAGYFRWRSREADFITVTRKLAQIRALNRAKPDIALELVPSLLELRQHFRLALVMGDRNGAETVVNTIDRLALDTAPNTAFMRIRLKTAFGDYPGIISSPDLQNVIALRMPQSVQGAIIAAFYAERLESYAARSDWKGMLKSYRESVHVEISDLIRGADPKQDVSVQRSIACCAAVENDPARVGMLLQVSDDPVVKALVSEVASHLTSTSGLLTLFDTAWRRQDWAAVQYAGALLLKAEPSLDAETRSSVSHVLRRSLTEFPNDAIEHLIRGTVAAATESRTMPQNWQEFSDAVRSGQLDAAYRFLVLDARPALEMSSLAQIEALQTTFEEVLTDPALHSYRGVDIAEVAASAIIEDLIRRPRYPEHQLRELYFTLFQFWVQNHQKSGRVEDEAVFLTLASGLLSIDVHSSVAIIAAAGSWWRTRRNRSRLRFLLEVLDLVLVVAQFMEVAWRATRASDRIHEEVARDIFSGNQAGT